MAGFTLWHREFDPGMWDLYGQSSTEAGFLLVLQLPIQILI